MDYKKYRIETDEIDLMSDHFPLTPKELEEKNAKKNQIFGQNIKEVRTTGRGFAFIGEDDQIITNFTYISSTGQFEMHYDEKALKEIEQRNETKRGKATEGNVNIKKKRQFFLKKIVIGALITGISLSSLTYIYNKFIGSKKDDEIVDVIRDDTYSINDSDLAVVVAWADYAMSRYFDYCNTSKYEDYYMPKYESAYQSYFIPIHSNYENYKEYETIGLSDELIGKSKKVAIDTVYDSAVFLNDALPDMYRFSATPYSRAVAKELADGTKNVYIPLDELNSSDYSINNLPEDAIVLNGAIYVLDDHLYKMEKSLKQ